VVPETAKFIPLPRKSATYLEMRMTLKDVWWVSFLVTESYTIFTIRHSIARLLVNL